VVNLHQLVHAVAQVIYPKGTAIRKINRANHGLGATAVGITGHGKNNLTAFVALNFAVGNGIIVIDRLAFVDVNHNILIAEKLDVDRVHVVHQPLKNLLIQFHKLVLLGEFQIAHRTGSFGNLILDQLRLIRQAKVRRGHSAKQNRARYNDEFPVQSPIFSGRYILSIGYNIEQVIARRKEFFRK
jgi:hypothetical protein